MSIAEVDDAVEPAKTDAISGTNYTRVRDAIRAGIVAGLYLPGTRLKVQELSAQYGVSTNPIREALQQLQGEGLVVISPNRGATVRLIDDELIRQIYEVSEAIEGIWARRCAIVATPEQVERLRAIEQKLEEATARKQMDLRRHYNSEFHRTIGTIAGNAEALSILARHRNLIRTIREQYGYAPARLERIKAEHRRMLEAIAAGNPGDAEDAARIHLVNARDDILSRFRGFQPAEPAEAENMRVDAFTLPDDAQGL